MECACGCGEPVRGRYRRLGGQGWRTQRFVSPAHALRIHRRRGGFDGRRHTEETKRKISKAKFLGDLATQRTGRGRALKLFKDPKPCRICGGKAERHHKNRNTLDNRKANIDWLCRKHHKRVHKQPKGPDGKYISREVIGK